MIVRIFIRWTVRLHNAALDSGALIQMTYIIHTFVQT